MITFSLLCAGLHTLSRASMVLSTLLSCSRSTVAIVSVGICKEIRVSYVLVGMWTKEQSEKYGRRLLTVGNMSSSTDNGELLLAINGNLMLRRMRHCQAHSEPHRQATCWLVLTDRETQRMPLAHVRKLFPLYYLIS